MKVKAKLTRKPAKVASKKAARKTVARQTKSKVDAKKTKVAASKTSCKKAAITRRTKPKTSRKHKARTGNLQTIEIRIDKNLLKEFM